MSMFDTQSVSSRSTLSAFPSSTTSVSHDSRDKKAAGFVAPNSRRGGRDFKVVSKQKSDASIGFVKKDKGTRGFRRVLGELIAGRSNSRNVVVVPADEPSRDRPETPKPRIGNKTSEWVQEEARRSQLREHELRRHEAEMRASETTVESLDDQSFYAFDLQSESDGFPVPPRRQNPSSCGSLSTFPNLSQISLRDSFLAASPEPYRPSSRSSTLLTPTAADPASRRLSSRSSPQLRPLLLPRTLPTDPLPPLPHVPIPNKLSSFPTISLPATPPASPPVESTTFPVISRSTTSSSLPNTSGDTESVLAPSPTKTRASHRQSYLPTTNSLGLAVTTAAPLTSTLAPFNSCTSGAQKKLDTTTRMLLKALSFDLVYLVKVSIPAPSSFSAPPSLEILSSSGMPRPQPKFDPDLHLSALRSTGGLLFHSPETTTYDREAYKTGLLMPIVSMRRVGYLLCAFTKDETKEIGERELRWVGKFAEELEGVVLGLGSRG